MRYEDKWDEEKDRIHKRNKSNSREYRKDDTIGKPLEGSILQGLATAAVVATGGVLLYRSGALKGVISSAIKSMDNYKGYVPEMANAVRQWTKSTPSDVNTIFNRKTKGALIDNFKKLSKDPSRVLEATIEDLKSLKEIATNRMGSLRSGTITKFQESLHQTDLMRSFQESNSVIGKIKGIAKEKSEVRKVLTQDIVNKNTTRTHGKSGIDFSEEVAAKLKRSGYREANLGDFIESYVDNAGNKNLRYISGRQDTKFDDDFLESVVENLKSHEVDNLGTAMSLFDSDETWKNLRIDSNILMSETGSITDLRGFNRNVKETYNSITDNFAIPFIRINPLKLLGLDGVMEKKMKYQVLSGNKKNPVLTGVRGVIDDSANLGSDHIFVNGTIYNYANETLSKVGDNYNLVRAVQDEGYGLTRRAENIRKMSGMSNVYFEDYTRDDGFFKYYYGRAMRALDIGFQDSHHIGHVKPTDPMSHGNILGKIIEKTRPYKIKDHNALGVRDIFGSRDENPLIAYKKSHKLIGNVLEGLKGNKTAKELQTDITSWARQFYAGKDMTEVTSTTLWTHFIFERLSGSLGGINLSLSTKNTMTTGDTIKNLLLKRVLPVYVGIEAWKYINYESENLFGTQVEDAVADTIVATDLAFHKFQDKVGLTGIAKKLQKLTPGSEQITDIPGFGALNMTRTYEERLEFWEKGETAVRKGRYWALGNTPFTGGKIEYHQPNWYRRVKSDWEYTESKWGSREEYHANSWMPTPRHPFAPFKKFVTDKYHWEEKHYKDRPYLMTAPQGSTIPIIGPLFAATIGKVIKPQRKMHLEYWYSNEPEQVTGLIDGQSGQPLEAKAYTNDLRNRTVIGVANKPIEDQTSAVSFKKYKPGSFSPANIYIGNKKEDEPQMIQAVYVTAGGQREIVEMPYSSMIGKLNEDIKSKGRKAAMYKGMVPFYKTALRDVPLENQEIENTYSLKNTISGQYNVGSELAGIYGFSMDSITKIGKQSNSALKPKAIEDPSYAYSMNRSFWDQNLGGLPGELSEIYRRFFPKRRGDLDYYNPIRNTQADWMPGEDYFTDFKKGDPYTKIPKGEMRLAGEAYERLNNVKDPLYLGIGSSQLGKTVDEMVAHFKKESTIIDEDSLDIVGKGTKVHTKIEKEWEKNGLLIDGEVKIQDSQNEILGYYDARIWDPSTPSGQAIAEVKTTNSKNFATMTQPRIEHIAQNNYYLVQSGLEKGYIYYYDRDNLELAPKVFEHYVDFELYNENMKNLQTAKSIIRHELDTGKISRGSLYSYFDRFKILADVAPYSQEYKLYNSMMSSMDLTEEEQKEVATIRSQVSDKKEPLRLYNYKFKTANLDYHTVTIEERINNELYKVKELDNPIRLAGVNVSSAEGETSGATEYLEKALRPGSKVRIGIDADPINMIERDSYKSIKAVVYRNKVNVNKYLLNNQMAEENTDEGPAAINAKFSNSEIMFGSLWERVAHLHTFTNTKFLQVRSPLESYKRREIYGKDFQRWSNPIKDFLITTFETRLDQRFTVPLMAFVGSMFGKTLYGKVVGATIGIAAASAGEISKGIYELRNNERWIPKRRREERELNEYMDMLKYVKSKKLYSEYAEKALKEDDFDVNSYMLGTDLKGRGNKGRRRVLEKQATYLRQNDSLDAVKTVKKATSIKYGKDAKTPEELISAINQEIEELSSDRRIQVLPENALKAIQHYDDSKKTLYGYNPGDPIQNVLSALPKKERQYFNELVKAPEEERMEILELVPKYMRRPLLSAWGIEADEKTNLVKYFNKYHLPDEEWEGWDEEVPLDAVKVKIIRKEARDIGEYNVWAADVAAADALGEIPIPQVRNKGRKYDTVRRLESILKEMGLKDIDIQEVMSEGDMEVSLNLSYDRRNEIERLISQRGVRLLN